MSTVESSQNLKRKLSNEDIPAKKTKVALSRLKKVFFNVQETLKRITAVAIYRAKQGFTQYVSLEGEKEAVKLIAEDFSEIFLPGESKSVKYVEGKISELS